MNKTVILLSFILIFGTLRSFAQNESFELSNLQNAPNEINVASFGAVGDGITDDTENLQKAFTVCSRKGLKCKIPSGKNFFVTGPLFLWGEASLFADNGAGAITFDVQSSPYLLNLGISGRRRLAKSFSGVISGITFKVTGGKEGRVIFFWRTDGASVLNNTFEVGRFAYSATSSGNDNAWLLNGPYNSIRKNISIIGNKIIAASDDLGSEGIGLGDFDGALIMDNAIFGVGDDPIGIHSCKNIKIIRNVMTSTDGRIFAINSTNIEIAHNTHARTRSLDDGRFYKGIALIYVGFDPPDDIGSPTQTDYYIHDNYLYYPPEATDHGAAIYLNGPIKAVVERNQIVNDSSSVTASAIHMLPAPKAHNFERDNIDISKNPQIWNILISKNISSGKFPKEMKMTGNCIEYKGARGKIKNNVASDFKFYCKEFSLENNGHIFVNSSHGH